MFMTFEWDPEHRRFLEERKWTVLATGRRDGTPQQSLVGYSVDDEGRMLVSLVSSSAKWTNIVRRPEVCCTVVDDTTHLVVYGEAEGIDADPLRAELTAEIFSVVLGQERADPKSLVGMLDKQGRVVVRITPSKTLLQQWP